jgi:biotin operon repressor
MEPTGKTPSVIIQRLKKAEADVFGVAQRYYKIISTINDLNLTEREIQLLAFTAIKGNISYKTVKAEFCEKYKSSAPTINNIISKLKRMGVLVKEGSKMKVNPLIVLNFEKEIRLEINMIGNG